MANQLRWLFHRPITYKERHILQTKYHFDTGGPTSYNLAEITGQEIGEFSTSWEKLQLSINNKELYTEDSDAVKSVLQQMKTLPFQSIEQKSGGTQFKLTVDFGDQRLALLKPMRFPRQVVSKFSKEYLYQNWNLSIFNVTSSLLRKKENGFLTIKANAAVN